MTDAEKRLREMVSMPPASHVTCPVAWVESVLADLDALKAECDVAKALLHGEHDRPAVLFCLAQWEAWLTFLRQWECDHAPEGRS